MKDKKPNRADLLIGYLLMIIVVVLAFWIGRGTQYVGSKGHLELVDKELDELHTRLLVLKEHLVTAVSNQTYRADVVLDPKGLKITNEAFEVPPVIPEASLQKGEKGTP